MSGPDFGPDFKRQRIGGFDPLAAMQGYEGMPQFMPMGGGDYGAYGPGAMGFGGYGMAMGQLFPCVKLRGLPFDVTEDDIRMFLGCDPIDVVLVKRDGRLSGEAFVVLGNLMQVDVALSKNRSYMGRRYIEIYRAKKADYYRAVASEVTEGGPGARWRSEGNMGAGAGYEQQFHGAGDGAGYAQGLPSGAAFDAATGAAPGGPGTGGGTTILKLRGLPYSVSDEDIVQWFDDASLGIAPVSKDNVLIVMEHGRPSGIAFVEFPSPQEATAAMGKNKQMLGTRYIEIFPANRADLERYKQRAGF